MSTAIMTPKISSWPPRSLARMAGVFQALEATAATYGQVIILGKLFVSGNAVATAGNILAHKPLFWLGFALSVVGVICHLAWALLLYDLMKPANRRVSLFALIIMIVGCAVQALTAVLYVSPLLMLDAGNSLHAFTADQLQALAYAFLRINACAFDAYLVFFGLWCALIGFLIFRSTFMPQILGVLLAISGVGWMVYLAPPVANHIFFPYITAASAIGEIPLMLWLLIAGVNEQRWNEQASAAAQVNY
jgi:hypothetical protein